MKTFNLWLNSKASTVIKWWEGCCCCCCWVTSVVSDSVRPHRRQPTRLPLPWDSPGKNAGVGCHFLLQCMKVKVKVKSLSCVRPSATPWTAAFQVPPSMGFSSQECWSGVPLINRMKSSRTAVRTSLVAQWIRFRLPMQGTLVRSLLWEDPTCCRATKSMYHSYWARAESLCSSTAAATAVRSQRTALKGSSLLSTTREKPTQQRRPSTAKN